jgi:mono/diheme cytochrome c family protein
VKTNTGKQFYLYCLLSAVCCFCLAGCHSGPQPMPLNQLNAQQTHGHAVFQTDCARCHDDRDDSSLHAPALLGVFKQQYLPSGSPATDRHIATVLQQGYGLMPPIANMDPQDLDDLLAYLHTL